MEISLDQLRAVLKSLSGPEEQLEPPTVVLQVVASLVGNSAIHSALSIKAQSRADNGDPVTTWRYVALTDVGLVTASLANVIPDWELDGSNRQDPRPTIDARLIPLREVTYCRVMGVEPRSTEEWTASWEIGIRDLEPLHLPTSRNHPDKAAASNLGRAIADRLR
ncbi:hypothetical protein [Kribbella ginsengisoli]|uniref:Uncharacterized protein n=1 Tax=Kribbella ginsengisoli TaxID=363865 RepID=A0ABP6Z6W8_9ACTN